MWAHVFNVEHNEHCEDCGEKLEIRFIGLDTWIFYCKNCLRHSIKPALDIKNGEDRK